MANSYSALYYHIVFSTMNRVGYIKPEIEQRVWGYVGGIARENRMTALQVGGVEDHVHVLVQAPPTLPPKKIVQLLKGGSSLWIGTQFPEIRHLAWQDGYGAGQQIHGGGVRKLHSESARAPSQEKFSARLPGFLEEAWHRL